MSSRRNKPRHKAPVAPAAAPALAPAPVPTAAPVAAPAAPAVPSRARQQKPPMEHFSVLLPSDLLNKLRVKADSEERPVSELVRLAIKAYLR